MGNRQFSERLNKELDDIGVPQNDNERIEVFAKLIKIPKFKAQALLNGNASPTDPLIEALADELEVNAQWLLGTSDKKQN